MKGTSESQTPRYCLVQFLRLKKTFHLQESPYKKDGEGRAGKKPNRELN